jgi:hypothetical protein
MALPVFTSWNGRRRLAAAVVLAVAAASVVTSSSAAHATETAAAAVNVMVNAREGLGTVPDTAYGLNQAVWDTNMNTQTSVDLLGQAGVRMMRYPGGSYGDGYHWQTHTVSGGGYIAPGTEFDSFMHTTQAIGAQAILIANYGSGTPEEAAAWVQYANTTKGYGVKYWEIGNEIFGNGYYGANWELDYHDSKSATTYANTVVQYANAMKAVDPTIKVGAVVTDPGNWPDGVVGSEDPGDWNRTVLSIAGPAIDFVIMHYYPNHTTAADVLQQTKLLLPGELAQLRQKINHYAGPNAANIGIALTETASNYQSDSQVGGLFAADVYFTALENLQMLSKVALPGDTLVRAGSDNQLVSVHAARNAGGGVSVELVNQDPANAYTVTLNYDGWTPNGATPTVYTFGSRFTAISTSQQGTAHTQVIPPYSIVTVKLSPSATNP